MKMETTESLCMELEKYAELENTELGEACLLLSRLFDYGDFLSVKFSKELDKEIKRHVDNFRKNTKIIETESTLK